MTPHRSFEDKRKAWEREKERADELREQLVERHDFPLDLDDSDRVCAECGTHEDVHYDPGESFDDLQLRCDDHHRLGYRFWMMPGDHPSVLSGNNVFECDLCDEEFVIPFGVVGRLEHNAYRPSSALEEQRCLGCTTFEWFVQFARETSRIDADGTGGESA